MSFPWRALVLLNTLLILIEWVGGYIVADQVLKGWPRDE